MNWLSKHYERVLLIVSVAILFVSSVSIWQGSVRLNVQFGVAPPAPSFESVSPLTKAEELATAVQKLKQPPQWTSGGRSSLFVPEKHFIGANELPATLQTSEVHPPVPNEWLEQFGLPIADDDVLDQDPDNDGFNNLNEWLGHTNPLDGNSHPEYYTKLKLKAVSEEPFRLIFSSWVEDTFAINTTDLKQPTQFLKVGDVIKGTRFNIVRFKEKYQPNKYGTNVDVSELTLEQKETKEALILIKEKAAISPELVATFVYSWRGRQQFQVRKDQEFSLKPQEQIKYKLIDVGPAKAVIANSQRADERIEIGLVTP